MHVTLMADGQTVCAFENDLNFAQYTVTADGRPVYQSASLHDAAEALAENVLGSYFHTKRAGWVEPWSSQYWIDDAETGERWTYRELLEGGFMDDMFEYPPNRAMVLA